MADTRLFILAFAVVIGTVSCASLPFLRPTALEAFEPYSADLPIPIAYNDPFIAIAQDRLVYFIWDGQSSYAGFAILQRNETGSFNNFTIFDDQDLISRKLFYTYYTDIATNGEWISFVFCSGPAPNDYTNFMLLRIFDNGTLGDMQFPYANGLNFFASRFLPDGSLIAVSSTANLISQPGLLTFRLINGNWTLVNTYIFPYPIKTSGEYGDRVIWWKHQIFVLTETHFIGSDNNQMYIYKRLANDSWVREDYFKVRKGTITSISWNGADAILAGYALDNQFALHQQNSNGTWETVAIVNASDAGYSNAYQFGMTTISVNLDTFLVLATKAMDNAADFDGRILIVQRYDSQWYISGQGVAHFDVPYSSTWLNFEKTDTHVYIGNQPNGLYSMPLCMFEPMQYTCQNDISFDMCDFKEFNASLFCTTNQTDCVNAVSTVLHNLQIEGNVLTVDYSLNRIGSLSQSGSVRIQCQEISSNTPNIAPSSSNTPFSGPSSTFIPVTRAPGTTPSDDGSKVTSTSSLNCALNVLGALVIILSIVF